MCNDFITLICIALGVGTTQLYNERRVYNHKRHGIFRLGNRKFRFIPKPFVPGKLTREFLSVDLVNSAKHLAEDQPSHLVENDYWIKHALHGLKIQGYDHSRIDLSAIAPV